MIRLFLIISLALTACVRADLYTASRACVRVSCSSGVGSGIVVGSDGNFYYALTNAHVATQATARVEFFDAGRITEATAQVVQRDADIDLAVLKINTNGYNPAIVPIDPSFSMKEGDVLCTIGHPLGKSPTAFFCTYRKTDPIFGVMFTPPPLEGRSGSPLLSKDGERVVGIVYGYTTADYIGLAIPARYVADFVQGAVNGTKSRTKWTPPKNSSVFRFTQMQSVLENPPDEEAATLPPSDEEVVETRRNRPYGPQAPAQSTPRRRFWWRPGQESGTPPQRRFLPFRNRKREPEGEIVTPELTGLTVRVGAGDVEVEVGKDEDSEKDEEKPARPVPPPPPPPQVIPPIYPVPWGAPAPPPGPPRRPNPAPRPAPRPAPPRFDVGILVDDGTVTLTQAPFQFPPQTGNCPGGNCPTCPGGNCPIVQKPQKPANIEATQPIPAQIVTPETELIPDAEPTAGAADEKKKPVTKEAEPPQANASQAGLDQANEKIGKLEAAQAETVRRVETLEKKVESAPTLFGRTPLGDAVENGLSAAGENLGKALTVEVGEDVKATLAQAVTTMKAGTEAAQNAEKTLENAEKSFTETMTLTQHTLAEIQECSANVTRVLWILTFGLLAIGFLWVCAKIGKEKDGND